MEFGMTVLKGQQFTTGEWAKHNSNTERTSVRRNRSTTTLPRVAT